MKRGVRQQGTLAKMLDQNGSDTVSGFWARSVFWISYVVSSARIQTGIGAMVVPPTIEGAREKRVLSGKDHAAKQVHIDVLLVG